MAYATQADMVGRYGEDAVLLVADRNGDGVIDTDVVERALTDATGEANSYLRAKYRLPLASVPEDLRRVTCDIAHYRLSDDATHLTDEKRQRYEDAMSWLKDLARGVARLDLPSPPTSASGGVVLVGPERRFTREKLGGVL